MSNGWLVPYKEEELGPPKGLIPLIAVLQQHKSKVCPAMDFWQLNHHVDVFTAKTDVCAAKLREWRQKGSNVSLLDLKRVYLQVHIYKTLWPFQTTKIGGQRYCLTRLALMWLLLSWRPLSVLCCHRRRLWVAWCLPTLTTSMSTKMLLCPRPVLENTWLSLDLSVRTQYDWKAAHECWGWRSQWNMENCSESKEAWFWTLPMSSRDKQCFLCAGGLSGTFQCVWLLVACGVLKRRASLVTKGWDDETRDKLLHCMISETVDSVQRDDPTHGDWCVDDRELNVWVDAISLAIGVALERHDTVLKDACWLQSEKNAQHINLVELDAVLKGINLALQWQGKVLHVKTDSVCMHHWVSDTLTGRMRVHTKAANEMLIRRRLNTLKEAYGGV